jgi:hypothetical protein
MLDKMKQAFPDKPIKVTGPFTLTYNADVCFHLSTTASFLTSQKLQTTKKHIIILHFILSGIDTSGSPAKICYEFLKPFFPNTLIYEEIVFDIQDNVALDTHMDKMQQLAESFSRCV